VNKADTQALRLGRRANGQRRAQGPIVHVPLDSGDGAVDTQILEHRGRREVARMEDRVGLGEQADAFARERARAARQMRVSEQRDQNRSGRKAPFR
jgi:hypothetical protein